jgi:hypothetical protein
MPQTRLNSWTATEARQAWDRERCEFTEIRAATRERIAKSRELMAEIDAALVAFGCAFASRVSAPTSERTRSGPLAPAPVLRRTAFL